MLLMLCVRHSEPDGVHHGAHMQQRGDLPSTRLPCVKFSSYSSTVGIGECLAMSM